MSRLCELSDTSIDYAARPSPVLAVRRSMRAVKGRGSGDGTGGEGVGREMGDGG